MTTSGGHGVITNSKVLSLALVATIAAYLAGNVTWFMQPIMIDQFISVWGFSASASGLVVSVEMAVIAFTGFALARLLKEARYLTLGGSGICLAIVSSFTSLQTDTFAALLLTRCVAGFGEGMVLMVANAAVACFADPDRTFARMGMANILFGVAQTLLIPTLHTTGSHPAVLLGMAIALCVLAPAILVMPCSLILRPATAVAAAGTPLSAAAKLNILLLAVGAFLIGMASGVLYAVVGVIGLNIGLSSTSVNNTIAASIFAGILGSYLALLISKSNARVTPVVTAILLLSAGVAALSFGPGVWMFRIAACLNVINLVFIIPFFFGASTVHDRSGRGATYVGGGFILSGAISPLVGGLLVDTAGTTVMGVSGIVASLLAGAIFVRNSRTYAVQSPGSIPAAAQREPAP